MTTSSDPAPATGSAANSSSADAPSSDTEPPSATGSQEFRRLPARGLRRGAFILPSLFTMGNILLGFYAVVLAHRGHFFAAGWVVVVAGILDMLDGRIARLTHTESEFGKEFDSLADALTFGAAPAWMSYLWGLHNYGRIGWLVPLFFLICTTVRLARFNVQTKSVDSRYFVGLPSPAAAATVICLFFVSAQLDGAGSYWMTATFFTVLPLSGSLMISTFRYPSFKRLDLRRKWSYRTAMLVAVVLLVLFLEPTLALETITASYMLSGPVLWLWGKLRRRGADLPAVEPESEQEPEAA